MCQPSCAPSERGATGRPRRGASIALLAACLAVVGVSNPTAAADPLPVRPAVILERDSGEVVGYLPLAPGERLGISFIHSVDKLPVEDWYVLGEAGLVQVSTRLKQYGAGMGHVAGQGRGQADGDWWEVVGLDRRIGKLPLRVGPASVDHRLHYRGYQILLSDCWPGERLTLRPAGGIPPPAVPAPLAQCPTVPLP